MPRTKIEPGQVYEIADGPSRFYYCAVALGEDVVFFDIVMNRPCCEVGRIAEATAFLRLAINHPTIKRAGWRLVGTIPIVGRLAEYGEYLFHGQIYSNKDASVRSASPAQTAGLEELAVWDAANQVTPILREHFFAEPTEWSNDIRSQLFHRVPRQ